jgi:hypothetical protein
MRPTARRCRCLTLHSYPAYVTADSWHLVIHVCHCGREHLNELVPLPLKKSRQRRTARKAPRRAKR